MARTRFRTGILILISFFFLRNLKGRIVESKFDELKFIKKTHFSIKNNVDS